MLRKMSVVAAVLLVVLPIGGVSYVAQADGPPAVAAADPAPTVTPAAGSAEPVVVAVGVLAVAWLASSSPVGRRRGVNPA